MQGDIFMVSCWVLGKQPVLWDQQRIVDRAQVGILGVPKEPASGFQSGTSQKAERERNPQLRLKIRGHFVRKKQGRLPRQREWFSKEQRQEAMGVGRGAASSLGRGWPAKRLQRRLLELCHVLKGPQKEKKC